MNTKSFLLLICTTTMLLSCKKEEKEPEPEPTTVAERIQGRWNVDKVVTYGYYDGIDSYMDTTYGTSADYYDFQNDGMLYTSFLGEADTSTYSVQGSIRLFINNNKYNIRELTNDHLTVVITYGLTSPQQGELESTIIHMWR